MVMPCRNPCNYVNGSNPGIFRSDQINGSFCIMDGAGISLAAWISVTISDGCNRDGTGNFLFTTIDGSG